MSVDCSAVLAPSRTLRAGGRRCRKRHPGQRWRAALCLRQVGTKGWVASVEPRDGIMLQRQPPCSDNRDRTGLDV